MGSEMCIRDRSAPPVVVDVLELLLGEVEGAVVLGESCPLLLRPEAGQRGLPGLQAAEDLGELALVRLAARVEHRFQEDLDVHTVAFGEFQASQALVVGRLEERVLLGPEVLVDVDGDPVEVAYIASRWVENAAERLSMNQSFSSSISCSHPCRMIRR